MPLYICNMELVYRITEIASAAREVWNVIAESFVITFTAEMGAGKTTLIHSLCRHIGVTGPMSSPTFSIINEYEGLNGSIYHIDLYRCKSEEEVIKAGVEECLHSGNLCFVEWPSLAEEILPPTALNIFISELDPFTRKLTFKTRNN